MNSRRLRLVEADEDVVQWATIVGDPPYVWEYSSRDQREIIPPARGEASLATRVKQMEEELAEMARRLAILESQVELDTPEWPSPIAK